MWILYWLGIYAHKALAQTGGTTFPTAGTDAGIAIVNPLACDNWAACLGGVMNGLIWICAPVVGVMILVGGFQIMGSSGNEEKLKKGKDTIIYACVGYAVVILATGVASIIQGVVGGAGVTPPPPGPGPGPGTGVCSTANPQGTCPAGLGQTCAPDASGGYSCRDIVSSAPCDDQHPRGSCSAGNVCTPGATTGYYCQLGTCDELTNGSCSNGARCVEDSYGYYHCVRP